MELLEIPFRFRFLQEHWNARCVSKCHDGPYVLLLSVARVSSEGERDKHICSVAIAFLSQTKEQ